MEGDLALSSAPLADLCGLLGIATSDLAAVEDADTLAHTFEVRAVDAARLNVGAVQAFVAHYGDAARLEIRTGDLTEIVLAPGIPDDAITDFAASAGTSGPFSAVVQVNKTSLAERIAGGSPTRRVQVFLFAEALSRGLARGIAWFEAEVWRDAPAPLVVAVLDAEVDLSGDLLAVVGGASLAKASSLAAAVDPGQDFSAIIASRDREIGWDSRWVGSLTPWHFDLSGTCSDPHLLGLLHAQLVKLAVLFTCDRARSLIGIVPPNNILAEYRGSGHVAVVEIDERKPTVCSQDEIAALLRVVDWCYQRRGLHDEPDWVSDRLPFVQTRVAQSLEPRPRAERLAALTSEMPQILEGIEWQWKAFIEGKVGEFLDRVQQVETIVSDTVGEFSDRTAALASGLSDTMLAAVAVLIGSFIAAAFSAPFNTALFRIGVLTYAAYVLLFPGAIGLVSSFSSLRASRSEFNTRVKRFNETLYPEKVNEILGTRIEDAQSTYCRWLKFVAAAYIVVAIAAGISAAAVPGLVHGGGTSKSTPSTTSTTAMP